MSKRDKIAVAVMLVLFIVLSYLLGYSTGRRHGTQDRTVKEIME